MDPVKTSNVFRQLLEKTTGLKVDLGVRLPAVRVPVVVFSVELEREDDGRWLAEVPALPGVMAYGGDRDEAVSRVQALALRVIAERLERGLRPEDL